MGMQLPLVSQVASAGSRAVVRVGVDVPVNARGVVLDQFRIKRAVPTLEWLLRRKKTVTLLAHRGQPHGTKTPSLSLRPVARRLSALLHMPVPVQSIAQRKRSLDSQRLVMLENLRFDVREERGSVPFARELAALGDFYLNDDFSTSHRAHASLAVLPRFLPHAAGLVVHEEVRMLSKLLQRARAPFVVVVGGAKVHDKLGTLLPLLRRVTCILVGGAASSTLLHARGYAMGRSLLDTTVPARELARLARTKKILLPSDVVAATSPSDRRPRPFTLAALPPKMAAYDVGPTSAQHYAAILRKAKTVFWAGAVGLTERRAFCNATRVLARAIPASAFSVAGGGDTIHALHDLGLASRFSFLSTGGGATLAFLAGEPLPALKALQS